MKILAFVALAIIGTTCNAFVFGEDERHDIGYFFPGNDDKFDQVGMIVGPMQSTAFVTGDDCNYLIGSAHGYYEKIEDNKFLVGDPKKTQNKFAYSNEGHKYRTHIKKILVNGLDNINVIYPSLDHTVAELDKRVVSCYNYPLDYEGQCNGSLYVVGYSPDQYGEKKMSKCGKPFKANGENSFGYCCDSKQGYSGAPIFCLDEKGLRIIGINNGAYMPANVPEPFRFGERTTLSCSPDQYYNIGKKFNGEFGEALKEILK